MNNMIRTSLAANSRLQGCAKQNGRIVWEVFWTWLKQGGSLMISLLQLCPDKFNLHLTLTYVYRKEERIMWENAINQTARSTSEHGVRKGEMSAIWHGLENGFEKAKGYRWWVSRISHFQLGVEDCRGVVMLRLLFQLTRRSDALSQVPIIANSSSAYPFANWISISIPFTKISHLLLALLHFHSNHKSRLYQRLFISNFQQELLIAQTTCLQSRCLCSNLSIKLRLLSINSSIFQLRISIPVVQTPISLT